MVVITQGAEETIVAVGSSSGEPSVEVKKVDKMPADQIVDTNGAGDAFAGGYLGGIAQGKSLDDAIELGHWLASLSIKLMGCVCLLSYIPLYLVILHMLTHTTVPTSRTHDRRTRHRHTLQQSGVLPTHSYTSAESQRAVNLARSVLAGLCH